MIRHSMCRKIVSDYMHIEVVRLTRDSYSIFNMVTVPHKVVGLCMERMLIYRLRCQDQVTEAPLWSINAGYHTVFVLDPLHKK